MIQSVTPLTATSQASGSAVSSGTASGASTSNASIASATNGLLDPNQFLSLLVDSLKYQNPLDPTSSAQFLSQLAALSQVQSEQQISQTQQVEAATSLIGQVVSGSDLQGVPVSGTATGFSITPNGPTINVGSDTISLGSIDSVGPGPGASSSTSQSATQNSPATPSASGG